MPGVTWQPSVAAETKRRLKKLQTWPNNRKWTYWRWTKLWGIWLDATHANGTADCVTNAAANPLGALGALVSGQAAVLVVIVALAERLPAASKASTATAYDVPHESPVSV